MRVVLAAGLLAVSTGLAGCHAISTREDYVDGAQPDPRPADWPVDVLSGRPNRPYRSLGTVEARVDRGTALKNPTLSDAIPALSCAARQMGADAVMLTHEEFTSWFDRGEGASPVHDLERQETWYVTEKARYVSGIAIAYTGPGATGAVGSGGYGPGTYMIPGPGQAPVRMGSGSSSSFGPGTYTIPAPGQAPVQVTPGTQGSYGPGTYVIPGPGQAPVQVDPSTTPGTTTAPGSPSPSSPPPPPPPAPPPPTLPEGPINLPPETPPSVAPPPPPPPLPSTSPDKPGGATTAALPAPRRVSR